MNCQIVHDSIHRRHGRTTTYRLTVDGKTAGSVAIAGPWTDKPTIFELYVVPPYRSRAFELFETLLSVMLHTYARDIRSEAGGHRLTKDVQKAGFVPCAHILDGTIVAR
jgi:hypothetical protein